VLRELGEFRERRGVITSGNLVRADLARQIRFNEALFIDQVDFDFCYSLRRRGYIVLQQKAITMDHVLGERYLDVERIHPYENAQRLYYIVRNSSYLVLRRRLLVRYYVVQVVVFCGAFVSINGVNSIPLCVAVVARGMVDAVQGRMGRREYPILKRGRR
jgi:GT2 family glycosyltransferase